MPQICVIIPAYNAAVDMESCLLSLKQQSFKDFEIIVVDDGSTDKTFEIAQKYSKVIRSEKNSGEGYARNLGARNTQAQILAFSDADVIMPENWLKNISEDMRLPQVKAVAGGYSGSLGNSFMEKFAYLELENRRRNVPEFVSTAVSNNFACYRDVFFEFKGFPEKYKCEDLRLSFLISRKYKIFWDKHNGVLHHFRSSLQSYLKQQYYFGRDTVWSYYQYPGMLKEKTHQGRGLYLEIISLFFLLISLAVSMQASFVFLLIIIFLNYNLLVCFKQNKLPVLKCLGVILARDLVCLISIFSGIVLALRDVSKKILRGKK